MADANRIAAALRYQQGMALPTPEPDSMVGRALDAAAQWGRGVQKNVSDLVSPTAWAEALKNPPRGVLSQMNPENKQEMINQGIDSALNFGPAMLGKIVYHGSPHRFQPTANNPLGEFDPMKIGTGEGAQAYGAGAGYLAEAPSVAKSYQGSVSAMHKAQGKPAAEITIGGKSINWDDPVQTAAFELSRHNGDRLAAAEFHAKTFAGGNNNPAVKILRSEQPLPNVDLPGSLYKVDLPDEQIAKMLDWDKPLSEQTPYVQKIINEEIKRIGGSASTGERAYKELMFDARMQGNKSASSAMRSNEEAIAASNRLRELGIPGIRYLDQGSRVSGQGTNNYVVFDPAHMKIIGRE